MPPSAPPLLVRARDPALVSVVVPAFNEEGNVRPLYERVAAALDGYTWELVVVDDGSRDGTFAAVVGLSEEDPRVRGVSFSRNFGHQYALLAGLSAARGDVVISMDADLQYPPELMPEMIRRWRDGYNIVHTKRSAGTALTVFKRWTSNLYYATFSALSGLRLEEGQSDFRLLDRRVVTALLELDHAELFLRGLAHWVGYANVTLPYEIGVRQWGRSKYDLRSMIRFALQGLTAFSTLPLRIGVALGALTSLVASLALGTLAGISMLGGAVPGWGLLAALTSLLFGVSFVLTGFLGIYLGHVFARVQRTPQFLIETTSEEVLGERRRVTGSEAT